MNSYQKMKQKYEARIKQLESDLLILLENKEPIKVITLRIANDLKKDMSQRLWFGDHKPIKKRKITI